MPAVINTNVASLNAQRNLNSSQSALSTSLQRLSSGLRVNSAKDDAAGLAIATRMDSQVRGMNVAIRNANDAISMSQVAEGALGKVADSMQRMRDLAVQAKNATNSTTDRAALNTEYQQLAQEVTRVLGGTTFNGLAILGADAGAQAFQVGAGNAAGDSITITTTDLTGDATITAVTGGDVTDVANSTAAITDLDAALATVNTQRATFGAAQNRFESVIGNLQVSVENQSAAKSRIMDADFAAETAALSRNQILQQAGTAMLAQANAVPQQVLQLLR
jgi:flagellin